MAQLPAPLKRSYARSGITYERIRLEDDYEVVHARTSSMRADGYSIETARVATENPTWNVGKSWAPADDPQLALDTDGSWYEEEMDAEIGDVMGGMDAEMDAPKPGPKKKKKRSEASVSGLCLVDAWASCLTYHLVPHRRVHTSTGRRTTASNTCTSSYAGKAVVNSCITLNALTVSPGDATPLNPQHIAASSASFRI